MLGILIVVAGGLVIALALIGYLGTPVQIERGSYRTGMAVSLILVGLSLAAGSCWRPIYWLRAAGDAVDPGLAWRACEKRHPQKRRGDGSATRSG